MTDSNIAIVGSYDPWLVALWVTTAMIVSYAALDLARRVKAPHGRTRFAWVVGGVIAMGLGIGSIRYMGMMALKLPVPAVYGLRTVLLFLFAAIVASAIAMFVVRRQQRNQELERHRERLKEEVAARTVLKQHKQKRHKKGQ